MAGLILKAWCAHKLWQEVTERRSVQCFNNYSSLWLNNACPLHGQHCVMRMKEHTWKLSAKLIHYEQSTTASLLFLPTCSFRNHLNVQSREDWFSVSNHKAAIKICLACTFTSNGSILDQNASTNADKAPCFNNPHHYRLMRHVKLGLRRWQLAAEPDQLTLPSLSAHH